MSNYTSNLKQWGDVGKVYPNGYSYTGGEPPVDEWDDFFNYNVEKDIQALIGLTNGRLDSGVETSTALPSSPTTGQLAWIDDSRRLAVYDPTSVAFRELTYKNEFNAHNHDSDYVNVVGDSMTGPLTLEDGSNAVSASWVNGSADVPNADFADMAGDADTLDGQHYSDIQNWVNTTADVPNATYADTAGDASTLSGHPATDFATMNDVTAQYLPDLTALNFDETVTPSQILADTSTYRSYNENYTTLYDGWDIDLAPLKYIRITYHWGRGSNQYAAFRMHTDSWGTWNWYPGYGGSSNTIVKDFDVTNMTNVEHLWAEASGDTYGSVYVTDFMVLRPLTYSDAQ